MEESRARYVEEFGLLFERAGGGRMLGRVLGVLMISDPPELSAEELANRLRASRGSISQSTRTLVQLGLVQRLSRPGERRDYFRVKRGAWLEATRRQMSGTAAFREMAERGLGLVDPDAMEARRNLEEMRDFYAHWERELPAIFERWEKEAEREPGDRDQQADQDLR